MIPAFSPKTAAISPSVPSLSLDYRSKSGNLYRSPSLPVMMQVQSHNAMLSALSDKESPGDGVFIIQVFNHSGVP